MANPIRPGVAGADTLARAAAGNLRAAAEAAGLLRGATQAGVVNLDHLAFDVAKIAREDPKQAADLLELLKPCLSAGDQHEFAQGVARNVVVDGAAQRGAMARGAGLVLDVAQLALSIAGIFDPTPTCDAIDMSISLLRGDWAGAAISAVSMVPYIGDAAKLAKLGRMPGVVGDATTLAKVAPDAARTMLPGVRAAQDALAARELSAMSEPMATGARALREALHTLADACSPPSALDAMRELKMARRAPPGAAGVAEGGSVRAGGGHAAPRIEDLLPNGLHKVISDDDRIVEAMLAAPRPSAADAPADLLPQAAAPLAQSAAAAGPQRLELIPERLLAVAAPAREKFVFRDAEQMLGHFGLTRVAQDPVQLGAAQAAHAALTGPDRANAYTRMMDQLAGGQVPTAREARAAFNAFRQEFRGQLVARGQLPPADVEHVLNLAHHPARAVDPLNLVVTSSDQVLGTKQHELLHWIKSGGDSVHDPRAWFMQVYADLAPRFGGTPQADRARPRAVTVEIPTDADAPVSYRRGDDEQGR